MYDYIGYSMLGGAQSNRRRLCASPSPTGDQTMNMYCKSVFATASLCLAVAIGAPSHAQTYPQKTIKIIVTAAPGGPADFPARIAAQILNAKFSHPAVVEHRPGAGGAIGAREVTKATPDGYTLLLGNTSTLAVIPAVSAQAGYDPVKNFTPIARIAEGFQVIAVHRSSPWRSLTELVDYAKANPGKLNWAHSGPGSLPHLAMEVFMMRTATKMTGVSYRSGGESVNALLSQAVQVTSEGIAGIAPQVAQGNLRALAMQNSKRNRLLPDLSTLAELGVPNAEADTFYGLVAPTGTPTDIVTVLNGALNEGMQSLEIQQLLAKIGLEAKPNAPEEFAAYIALQHRRWLEIGKAAGVTIN
jgi:tripartite-type tricarboxylate transporter receptor subunit TctC